MNEKLNFTREYPFSIEAVWRAITEKEALSDWLMTSDFRAEEGAEFSFSEPGLTVNGKVLKVVPHRELCYFWTSQSEIGETGGPEDEGTAGNPSVVTWTLTPTPGKGTRVTLQHEILHPVQPIVSIEAAVNWSYAIHSSLAGYLASSAKPPVPIVYLVENREQEGNVLERAGFRQPQETRS